MFDSKYKEYHEYKTKIVIVIQMWVFVTSNSKCDIRHEYIANVIVLRVFASRPIYGSKLDRCHDAMVFKCGSAVSILKCDKCQEHVTCHVCDTRVNFAYPILKHDTYHDSDSSVGCLKHIEVCGIWLKT